MWKHDGNDEDVYLGIKFFTVMLSFLIPSYPVICHCVRIHISTQILYIFFLSPHSKKGSCHCSLSLIFPSQNSNLTGTWRNHWRDELLLSTFCGEDLDKKHSGGWDNDHVKCRFCVKGYRFRTFPTQCHMTSQTKEQKTFLVLWSSSISWWNVFE